MSVECGRGGDINRVWMVVKSIECGRGGGVSIVWTWW